MHDLACITVVAVLAFAVGAGCGGTDATEQSQDGFDPTLAAHLQATLDQSRAQQHALGAVAGVRLADGATWIGASGSARPDQTVDLRTTDRFAVASITKTFTATLTMQLVQEGQLHLDDTLDAWYPSLPNATQITIRNLLSHTSGVAEFMGLVSNRGHHEPDDLIEVVAAQPSLFPPGTQWSYSNTNYFLLGRIIEKTLGVSYLTALRSRLLGPLGLNDTFLEGQEEIPGGFVRGGLLIGPSSYADFTDVIDPSLFWAAGGLVSTAADMLRWLPGLFGGTVLGADTLAAMIAPTVLADGSTVNIGTNGDLFSYGFGVVLNATDSGIQYGHDGSRPGFTSQLYYQRDRALTMVTLCNDSDTAPDGDTVCFHIREDISQLLANAGLR